MKISTLFFVLICGVLIFFVGNTVGYSYYHSEKSDISGKLEDVSAGIDEMINNPKLQIDKKSAVVGGVFDFAFALAVIYKVFCKKNLMPGKEHGSAEWGTASDIVKYKDKKPENNMPLTQTESMSINTRQTMRNNNILVIGGSGSGKTRFFLKPSAPVRVV